MDSILDILPLGVFLLDAEFHVADVNSAICEFFGIQRVGVLGQDKRALVKNKISRIFENGDQFCERVLATYNDNTYIERFVCHVLPEGNRQERWLEHSSQPIVKGSLKGGRVEIYSDVTDRVLAEKEIRWITAQAVQVTEQEKSRIACNLHDGLGQTILAIKFTLEHILENLKKQPNLFPEVVELRKAIDWVENIGLEVSEISSNLMPSMLAPLGLDETMVWLKDQYSELYRLNIQYQSYGMKERRLPEAMEVAIFRIFQESINNIIKHASAQHVQMKLVCSYPMIIVTITDDGVGFNPENVADMGIGLRIMKQRVLELNGTLKIISELQKGTTIRAEFPAPKNHYGEM